MYNYVEPEMTIVYLDNEDVIVTSGGSDGGSDTDVL